jgi:hypothetical protein
MRWVLIECRAVLPAGQVAALAEATSDRATRVRAAEFLHAVTLWMIGGCSRLVLLQNRTFGMQNRTFGP